MALEPEQKQAQANLALLPSINNIRVKVKDGNFVGRAYVKLGLKIGFNIYGKVLVDLEKKEVTIKNFTVKKGIIPITRIALLAIKRMRIESVKIVGNTLTIKI